MYAYADESGNTGTNLLDATQPDYFAGALMSIENIDERYHKEFAALAKKQGVECLHAAEMGMGRLLPILPRLEALVKRDTLRFFMGRMNKRWFILAKFFDVLFDPHDNRAAPYHVYWVSPLRYIMLLKLASIVDDEALGLIWKAVCSANYDDSKEFLFAAIRLLKSRLDSLPDARSIEIITEVFNWAEQYPDELGLRFKAKKHLVNHYPNVAMLTPILGAVQKQSEYWNIRVKTIKHDQCSQFQSTWKELHKVLSNATEAEYQLIMGPKIKIGAASGSQFEIVDSRTSAGIQLIDIVLWLWKKKLSQETLPANAESFLSRVMRNAENYEMSYDRTVVLAETAMAPVMAREFTLADEQNAKALLAQMEVKRQSLMQELKDQPQDNQP